VVLIHNSVVKGRPRWSWPWGAAIARRRCAGWWAAPLPVRRLGLTWTPRRGPPN